MALTKITGEGIGTTSGNLTVDVAGDIILDADGGDVTIKDGGTSIGAISNTSSDLSIYSTASGHSGIRFHENGILPTNNAGALIDNDAVLGDASYRYTNLFLSGGVYLGGTGSNSANYVKVGKFVTCYCRINSFSDTTTGNSFSITNLPFTISVNGNDEGHVGDAWGAEMGDNRSLFFYSASGNITNVGSYYGATNNDYNQVTYSNFTGNTNMLVKLHYITT